MNIFLLHHDSVEYTARTDAQATSREEVFVLGVGADVAIVNLLERHSLDKQLQAIGHGEINVIFLLFGMPMCYLCHIVASVLKGFIHLNAHLESLE